MAYTVQPVRLSQGLDLVSPKLVAAPGSMLDGENYEVVAVEGYKAIDGFTRYDGRVSPYAPTWFEIADASYAGSAFNVGDILGAEGESYPFGICVEYDGTTKTIRYIRINADVEPTTATQLTLFPAQTLTGFTPDASPIDGQTALDSSLDASDVVDTLNGYYTTLAAYIGSLPNRPHGLHFHRDTLYAVADEEVMGFNSGGTTEVLPGDIITNGSFTATVIDVAATGDWTLGTAAGDMLVHVTAGSIPTSGNLDITRPSGAVVNACTAVATTTASWKAGMWKGLTEAQAIDASADTGWNRVNTGWLVNFEEGSFSTEELPKLNRFSDEVNYDYLASSTIVTGTNGTFNTYAYGLSISGDPATTPGTGCVIAPESGTDSDTISYLQTDEGNTVDITGTLRSKVAATAYSRRAVLRSISGITTNLPEESTITGIEVKLYYDTTVTNYVSGYSYVDLQADFQLCTVDGSTVTPLGSEKSIFISGQSASVSAQEGSFGGDGDLWGLEEIDADTIRNTTFGITFRGTAELIPGTDAGEANIDRSTALNIDRIEVIVHYESRFIRYYFWDGVDDVQADLIDYRLTDGDLLSGDAVGLMQLANLTNVTSGGTADRYSIKEGDEIHIQPGGAVGTKIGIVSANMSVNAPPALADIVEANSRYQFISANYYATDEWDQFFGVSGAGRAFSFDGSYYITIYTRDSDAQDIPRHLAYHHGHLALGFRSGLVAMSVPGEPENFSGLLGAQEFPVGDKITGLLPLNGTTLGVFCESSIWSLIGTIGDQISTAVIAPNTGAIEYTVVDIGMPVFCNANGISTLDQTAAYGDFMGRRLSYAVSPWLVPRLRTTSNLLSVANGAGIVCAIPNRTDNQYRLFFRDGRILTMTMNSPDQAPAFTFQRYYLGQDGSANDDDKFLVPLAWSSQMDDTGRERIHISHYSPLSAADSAYVYELNDGWSFDGKKIPLHFETNWFYGETPSQYMNLRKLRAEGLSRNYATVNIFARGIQPDNTNDLEYAEEFGDHYEIIDLPRDPGPTVPADFVPRSNLVNVDARGLAYRLRFEGSGDLDSPQPPHVFQILIMQADPEGADDQ